MRLIDHPFRLVVLTLCLLEIAPAASAQDGSSTWQVEDDSWYILEIAGARSGWMHSIVTTNGEMIRSDNVTEMSIGRGRATITIRSETRFLETVAGTLLTMSSLQDMSLSKVRTEWTFGGDSVTLVTTQGGRALTKVLPLPEGEGKWLTPWQVAQHVKSQIEAGERTITYSMLTPDHGLKPVKVEMTYAGDDRFETKSESHTVTVWSTRTTAVPLPVIEWYNDDGVSVYSEINIQIGQLVTKLSTEAIAKAPQDEVPELMLNTFVKPDRPIRRSMKTRQARLRLRARNGELPELPSAGAQRVTPDPDGSGVILEIDTVNNLPASTEEMENEEYLGSSSMIDPSDPLLKKLAARAVKRAGSDDFDRAEALRKYVNRHISRKGLATAFASASETARTKRGDCSEHGVLLAGLLRAEGIPARVASGLVYAESFAGEKDIFGWHMWTQALIDGAWVDFDATLPARYNAAHVLTGTSSLADGLGGGDLDSVLLLLGNLDIDVLDVGYDEKDSGRENRTPEPTSQPVPDDR